MALSWQRRVEDLEQKMRGLLDAQANGNARTATPLNIRNGKWYGVTDASLSPGGTVAVSIWVWSVTDSEWQDSGTNITAQDWYLNTSEAAVPAGTRVRIEWYVNVWVISDMYCDVVEE
jgi:hypothetical protein